MGGKRGGRGGEQRDAEGELNAKDAKRHEGEMNRKSAEKS